MAFANVVCAYTLWVTLGLFGAHRFYVGRTVSGFVWMFTFGLFGIGWIIDVFLIPEFVEEHNKKVFHQQMLETGSALLFDGEYGGGNSLPYGQPGAFASQYPANNYPGANQAGAFSGQVAPYASHKFYAQPSNDQPFN